MSKLLSKSVVLFMRDDTKSTLARDIAAGLWSPAVPRKPGGRSAFWPEHEVSALLAAAQSGMGAEQVRALVKELLRQRAQVASALWLPGSPDEAVKSAELKPRVEPPALRRAREARQQQARDFVVIDAV
jgi:hypothetical protein